MGVYAGRVLYVRIHYMLVWGRYGTQRRSHQHLGRANTSTAVFAKVCARLPECAHVCENGIMSYKFFLFDYMVAMNYNGSHERG